MRILWSANGFWAGTGYGVQSKHILPGFQRLGHEVAQHAWYGLQGGALHIGDVPIYPMARDIYGNDVAPIWAQHFCADLLITLIDVWVQDPNLGKRAGIPWLAYFPIDSAPLNPAIRQRLDVVDYPVQYSKFGLEVARQAGGPECHYVPHGCNTAVFTPPTAEEKRAARATIGVPQDGFLCSMVAANKGDPSRKGFWEQLSAFAAFKQTHPDALLYIHTHLDPQAMGGCDIPHMLHDLGVPDATVFAPNPNLLWYGLPEEHVAAVYRASDVLLAATYSEGFGIPIIEAQASGTPVITNNFSAMPELTTNGLCVDPLQSWWVPGLGGCQAIPSIEGIHAALCRIYDWDAATRTEHSLRGVQFVREGYSWDVVINDYWRPLLERVEAERGDRQYRQYVAVQDAFARRDAEMPRGEVDAWYNAHRFGLARQMLDSSGVDLDRALICDLGCAEGEFVATLPGAREGVDISEARIKVARERTPDMRLAFHQADAAQWGRDATYDVVVCLELIEHVLDPSALLQNIARILKPGGIALIATPNDPEGVNVDGREHLRGYGWKSLEEAARTAGLAVRACRSTVPGLYGRDGLLMHPERLAEYQERARGAWDADYGSNLYLLADKPALVTPNSRAARAIVESVFESVGAVS